LEVQVLSAALKTPPDEQSGGFSFGGTAGSFGESRDETQDEADDYLIDFEVVIAPLGAKPNT
jgi:hypothetical protein